MRTPRGRVATDAAWEHLDLKPKSKVKTEDSHDLFSDLEE